jgi:hypothetical protein
MDHYLFYWQLFAGIALRAVSMPDEQEKGVSSGRLTAPNGREKIK